MLNFNDQSLSFIGLKVIASTPTTNLLPYYKFQQTEINFGRAPFNEICIISPTVSTFQTTIIWQDQAYYILASQGAADIYLNHLRVADKTELKHGDQIKFGNFIFEVDLQLISDQSLTLFGRYRLDKIITTSQLDKIYLAHHLSYNEKRVIKQFTNNQYLNNRDDLKRAIKVFQREIEILYKIDHPAIAKIDNFFTITTPQEINYYVVMQYFAGITLAHYIAQEACSQQQAILWAIEICDALIYLYEHYFVYRQLTPNKIIIDNDGHIRLIDGWTRNILAQRPDYYIEPISGYASPEFYNATNDQRSDIFSLAAILFHLLTGVNPLDNPLLVFDFTHNAQPKQLNNMISTAMNELLCRALSFQPTARFNTMLEMKAALASIL